MAIELRFTSHLERAVRGKEGIYALSTRAYLGKLRVGDIYESPDAVLSIKLSRRGNSMREFLQQLFDDVNVEGGDDPIELTSSLVADEWVHPTLDLWLGPREHFPNCVGLLYTLEEIAHSLAGKYTNYSRTALEQVDEMNRVLDDVDNDVTRTFLTYINSLAVQWHTGVMPSRKQPILGAGLSVLDTSTAVQEYARRLFLKDEPSSLFTVTIQMSPAELRQRVSYKTASLVARRQRDEPFARVITSAGFARIYTQLFPVAISFEHEQQARTLLSLYPPSSASTIVGDLHHELATMIGALEVARDWCSLMIPETNRIAELLSNATPITRARVNQIIDESASDAFLSQARYARVSPDYVAFDDMPFEPSSRSDEDHDEQMARRLLAADLQADLIPAILCLSDAIVDLLRVVRANMVPSRSTDADERRKYVRAQEFQSLNTWLRPFMLLPNEPAFSVVGSQLNSAHDQRLDNKRRTRLNERLVRIQVPLSEPPQPTPNVLSAAQRYK